MRGEKGSGRGAGGRGQRAWGRAQRAEGVGQRAGSRGQRDQSSKLKAQRDRPEGIEHGAERMAKSVETANYEPITIAKDK